MIIITRNSNANLILILKVHWNNNLITHLFHGLGLLFFKSNKIFGIWFSQSSHIFCKIFGIWFSKAGNLFYKIYFLVLCRAHSLAQVNVMIKSRIACHLRRSPCNIIDSRLARPPHKSQCNTISSRTAFPLRESPCDNFLHYKSI